MGTDDPRDIARAYLRRHNIDALFQELGAALMYERPVEVEMFLIDRLEEFQVKQEKKQQSSIFSDQDLDTLFNMYDQEKTSFLTKDQCIQALRVLGVQGDLELTSDSIDKQAFISLCNSSLVIGNTTSECETEQKN